jgi:hypothetical protein
MPYLESDLSLPWGGVQSSDCLNTVPNASQTPMDPTKPHGEACTPNGGLKEAHEISWVNDPDDDPDDDAAMTRKSAVNQSLLKKLTLIRQELPAMSVWYPNHFECVWGHHMGSEYRGQSQWRSHLWSQ